MKKIVFLLFILFASFIETSAQQSAQQKVIALVIGNAEYENAPKLRTPIKDCDTIAQRFKELGYYTEYYKNVKDKTTLNRYIQYFARRSVDYDVAIFYYAGHGFQVNTTVSSDNFMVPTSASVTTTDDIGYQCVPIGNVADLLNNQKNSRCHSKILFIDACRIPPSLKGINSTDNVIERDYSNCWVMFSTRNNQPALDKMYPNDVWSPFAQVVMLMLQEPDMSLEKAPTFVNQQMTKIAGGNQFCSVRPNHQENFVFNPTVTVQRKESDELKQARSLLKKHDIEGTKKVLLEAIDNSILDASYEYAKLLMRGTFGEKDTLQALAYLVDIIDGNPWRTMHSYFVSPLLQDYRIGSRTWELTDRNFHLSNPDLRNIVFRAKATIDSLCGIKGSHFKKFIYSTRGRAESGMGDFVEAEKWHKKATEEPFSGEFYCSMAPELHFGLFYLHLDYDYITISDTVVHILENMGLADGTSLREYSCGENVRGINDNAAYWLETFINEYENCDKGIIITQMGYSIKYLLYFMYRYGIPHVERDTVKALYYDTYEDINDEDFSPMTMARQYDKNNDLYNAIRCYSIALLKDRFDDANRTKETCYALNRISDIYRTGCPNLPKNEQLACKIKKVASLCEEGERDQIKYKTVFDVTELILSDIDLFKD